MPYLQVFKIRPGDTRQVTVDLSSEIPSGAAIAVSGHAVSATEHYAGGASSVLVSATPTIVGTSAVAIVHGVLLDERHDLTFSITLTDATPSVVTKKVLVIGVDTL